MYTSVEISWSGKAFDECLFHATALFGILLNYKGKANGIVNSQSALFNIFPQIQVVEKAYCFLTDAALFTIFFNNKAISQCLQSLFSLKSPPNPPSKISSWFDLSQF